MWIPSGVAKRPADATEAGGFKLGVLAPPHVHCGRTTPKLMREFTLALMPAAIMAVYTFGLPALRVMALAVAVSVLTEFIGNRLQHLPSKADSFHAVVVGLLFSFMLPANSPWWLVTVGAIICMGLGLLVFGGLGANLFCPPVIGWAILTVSWPTYMDPSAMQLNSNFIDPLLTIKTWDVAAVSSISWLDLLMGRQMAGLGSAQVGALLLGGAFMLARVHIPWQIPAGFIFGVGTTAAIAQAVDPTLYADPFFYILSGSTVFGAFFLATEFGGSPVRPLPRFLYGLFGGVMTMIIRIFGIYPDGVPFAILLANIIMPLVDAARPKPFGRR